jgi:4-hydroxy-tetrahydrodipicolinate reductase
MGTQILRLLPGLRDLQLTGAVASESSAALGQDAGLHVGAAPCGVPIGAALEPLLTHADIVVDFSVAGAVQRTLRSCAQAGVALLVGATGLPAQLASAIENASKRIALMIAPNTSVGVNLLLELVQRASRALPMGYDIEIVETHHRQKVDAPSGTALAIGQAAAEGRGQTLDEVACYARHGHSGPRERGQIGIAALRGGDVVGEHQVRFLGAGESLLLEHRVTDRAVFARGALLAALWLARQPPGRYTMRDFLSAESAG